MEKAVIGVGEYRFCEEFKYLEIPLRKWSSMTKMQRTKHLQKITKFSLEEAKVPPSSKFRAQSTAPTNLRQGFRDLWTVF